MWDEYFKAYLQTDNPDHWEFIGFIVFALDQAKIPLPEQISGDPKSDDDEVK